MAATIKYIGAGFEVDFNEISQLPEVNQTNICIRKDTIQEVMLNKGSLYENNLPVLAYTLVSGREYYTHAGIVKSGVDGAETVYFTDDNTADGTPDTIKLYNWVRDRYLS